MCVGVCVCVCERERDRERDRYTSGGAVTSTDAAHEQRQVTRTSLSHLGPELSNPREVGIIGTNECNTTQHTVMFWQMICVFGSSD